MKGFINIGNSCYLNSALQMLIRIPELFTLIKASRNKDKKINKLYNYFSEYNNKDTNSMNPQYIKDIVGEKKTVFLGHSQEDSAEFLIYFFEVLNTLLGEKEMNKIFGIETLVSIKCKLKKCLAISQLKEMTPFLILDIRSNSENLDDCYRTFKEKTKLQGDNKYFCEKCQALRLARKKMTINNWPNNLIIWLKRFQLTPRGYIKNNKDLDIPFEWRHDYYLQGGVIHFGGLNGGHYVYFGKVNDNWFLFNDSSVSRLDKKELYNCRKRAYLLHYKKLN